MEEFGTVPKPFLPDLIILYLITKQRRIMKMCNYLRAFVLLIATMAIPGSALAYDCIVDGLCYDLNESTATVVAKSESDGNQDYVSGDVVIPEEITYNGIKYTVTEIGENAFRYCKNITSIHIPNTIKGIRHRGIDTATPIPAVTIPEAVLWLGNLAINADTVYFNATYCSSLDSEDPYNRDPLIKCNVIEFGDEVRRIPSGLIKDNNTIKEITIPESVSYIGDCAFIRCI